MSGRLLGGNGAPQQQVPMQIATPLNDIQLTALMAVQLYEEPVEPLEAVSPGYQVRLAVSTAMEIVAEAIVQAKNGRAMEALVQEKMNRG